jgi:hypothetical protein
VALVSQVRCCNRSRGTLSEPSHEWRSPSNRSFGAHTFHCGKSFPFRARVFSDLRLGARSAILADPYDLTGRQLRCLVNKAHSGQAGRRDQLVENGAMARGGRPYGSKHVAQSPRTIFAALAEIPPRLPSMLEATNNDVLRSHQEGG